MKKYRIKQFYKNGIPWYKTQRRILFFFWTDWIQNSTFACTCLKTIKLKLELLEKQV